MDASCLNHLRIYTSMQYDLVKQLSPEEQNAFTQLADFCTNGQWIITSAQTGFNVEKAVHMIVELV